MEQQINFNVSVSLEANICCLIKLKSFCLSKTIFSIEPMITNNVRRRWKYFTPFVEQTGSKKCKSCLYDKCQGVESRNIDTGKFKATTEERINYKGHKIACRKYSKCSYKLTVLLVVLVIIPLFTLSSIYSTNASAAEQMPK